jgi:hypothetical protein
LLLYYCIHVTAQKADTSNAIDALQHFFPNIPLHSGVTEWEFALRDTGFYSTAPERIKGLITASRKTILPYSNANESIALDSTAIVKFVFRNVIDNYRDTTNSIHKLIVFSKKMRKKVFLVYFNLLKEQLEKHFSNSNTFVDNYLINKSIRYTIYPGSVKNFIIIQRGYNDEREQYFITIDLIVSNNYTKVLAPLYPDKLWLR